MDHKQAATPFGRRARLLYPDWNNCSTREPPQKALVQKRLPFALGARAGAFPAQLTEITHPQNFARQDPVRPVRGQNSRLIVPARIGRNNFVSLCCRYRPGLMLLRLQPVENDISQGFSEAGEPHWRNLRGAARKREPRTRSTNLESSRQRQRARTLSVPDSSNRLARSERHFRPMSSAFNVGLANVFPCPKEGKNNANNSINGAPWATNDDALPDGSR